MVEQGEGGGAMSFLKRFPPPADGVRHQQPDTEALLAGRSLGTGTLYIAERCGGYTGWEPSETARDGPEGPGWGLG